MSRFRQHIKKQAQNPPAEKGTISNALLNQARKSGQLNLSNRELKDVPSVVWNLNKPPASEKTDASFEREGNWWEQVDLSKLILASNLLSSLPEELSELHALAILDVHDNKLRALPDAVASWDKLEKLDASHNDLGSLPEALCLSEFLTALLLQHNKLQCLPEGFAKLTNLQVLDLSHNDLTTLPPGFGQLQKLQRLNLSHNKLEKFTDELCLPLLLYLDLDYNKISSFPDKWSSVSALKELHLRNNLLTTLPNFSACASLKEVYCASNRLEHAPISSFPASLAILELRDNKIKEIDPSIVNLEELQRLDVANNNISTLPPKMGLMETLKALNVDGNPMRGLRRDIISRGTQAIMKYLQSRIVENVGDGQNGVAKTASSLPVSAEMAEVAKMHSMATSKVLDLSKNVWSESSAKLMQDCKDIPMETINLSRTGISEIPLPLYAFQSSLKVLNVSLNKVTILDAKIGTLSSVTHLDLSSNQLTDLPSEIANLNKLIELNVFQNKLTILPECIFQLESLEHLLAGGNQISAINVDGLRNLPRLSTLALQNNNIAQVPPQLGLITTIRNLQLEGNIFRIPRQNIMQQGTQAVLEYLRGRVPTS